MYGGSSPRSAPRLYFVLRLTAQPVTPAAGHPPPNPTPACLVRLVSGRRIVSGAEHNNQLRRKLGFRRAPYV